MSNGWQVSEMPEQQGRRAIVTGGNSGIGYPVVLELARRGAEVVIATRNRARGEDAVARVRCEVPGATVEFEELDLASLASVRSFAARELSRNTPLDLLINNAGILGPPQRSETPDGSELTFGTNVLGPFALAGLLLPALVRTAGDPTREPSRIVTLASVAHKFGRLHFEDLQYRSGYAGQRSYNQSKLANLVLALELDRRLRAGSLRVLSVAAHPGLANTNIFQVGKSGTVERTIRQWMGKIINATLNTAVDGALPTLYAATAPDAASGGYYGPQELFEARGGDVGPANVAVHAQDTAAAAKLWTLCEELTGVYFLDETAHA